MHHTCAKDLQPAGVFADAAPLAVAERAIDIDLGARFREREVAATEAHAASLAEELLRETLQAALEIGHRAKLVDQEALDLVEHRLVRRVDRLVAVDLAGDDDAHGWSHLLHGPHLHG